MASERKSICPFTGRQCPVGETIPNLFVCFDCREIDVDLGTGELKSTGETE